MKRMKICSKHYFESRKDRPCITEGCPGKAPNRRLCNACYKKKREQERFCDVDGCTNPSPNGKKCEMHRGRMRRSGSLETTRKTYTDVICTEDGCDRPARSSDLCTMHYQRLYKRGSTADPYPETCTVEGCNKPFYARKICAMHYARWNAHGDPNIVHHRSCETKGCDNQAFNKKPHCNEHYTGKRCSENGCVQPVHAKNRCAQHYDLNRRGYAGKSRYRIRCFKRDDYTCHICEKKLPADDLHAHHIIPVSMDGPDDLENMATLCHQCHSDVHYHKVPVNGKVIITKGHRPIEVIE